MTTHTKAYDDMIGKLKERIPEFQRREPKLDALNSFPFENVRELQEIGYTTLTLPKEFGGEGMGLREFLKLQEQIAKGCGSTALSIGWHMGTILEFAEHRQWNRDTADFLIAKLKDGALINTAASERNAGSPLRGGKPNTTAVLSEDGKTYQLTGEKVFTSASPVLDYFFVTATIDHDETVATFLVPRDTEGLSIRETWDSVALRGTASHDLVLDQVRIPAEFLTEHVTEESKKRRKGWMLHIPVCYLGIAGAARDYAVKFAAEYVPSSLGKPIGTLPSIRQHIGEIDFMLISSREFLYSIARQYEEESPKDFKTEMAAVKTFVTNQAISIVDLAMRVVGARSLSEKNPLHRYYQNVRAGLHNPPMDDITFSMLANEALKDIN